MVQLASASRFSSCRSRRILVWVILFVYIATNYVLGFDPLLDIQNLPYAHPIINTKDSLQDQLRSEFVQSARMRCPTDNPRPTYFELKAKSLELLKLGQAKLARICMQAAMDLYLNRVGQFGAMPSELPSPDAAKPYLNQAQYLAKTLPGAQVPAGVRVDPLFRGGGGGGDGSNMGVDPNVGGALMDDAQVPQRSQPPNGMSSPRLEREDDTPILNILSGGKSRPSVLPTSAEVPTPTHHADVSRTQSSNDPNEARFWSNSDQSGWRKHSAQEWIENPQLQLRVATVYAAQLLTQRETLGTP